MVIIIDRTGEAIIKIYRKQYRKARFLRHAARLINKYKEEGMRVTLLAFERTH